MEKFASPRQALIAKVVSGWALPPGREIEESRGGHSKCLARTLPLPQQNGGPRPVPHAKYIHVCTLHSPLLPGRCIPCILLLVVLHPVHPLDLPSHIGTKYKPSKTWNPAYEL